MAQVPTQADVGIIGGADAGRDLAWLRAHQPEGERVHIEDVTAG